MNMLVEILIGVILDSELERRASEFFHPPKRHAQNRGVRVADRDAVAISLEALRDVESDEIAERWIVGELRELCPPFRVRLLPKQAVLPQGTDIGGRIGDDAAMARKKTALSASTPISGAPRSTPCPSCRSPRPTRMAA